MLKVSTRYWHPPLTLYSLLPRVALLGVCLAPNVHLVGAQVGAGHIAVLAVECLTGQLLHVRLALEVSLQLLPAAQIIKLTQLAAERTRV